MEMEVPKDKIISFSDIEDFEDETSIFEEFDKAIAEYEEDLLTNQSLQEQVSLSSKEGKVDSFLILGCPLHL